MSDILNHAKIFGTDPAKLLDGSFVAARQNLVLLGPGYETSYVTACIDEASKRKELKTYRMHASDFLSNSEILPDAPEVTSDLLHIEDLPRFDWSAPEFIWKSEYDTDLPARHEAWDRWPAERARLWAIKMKQGRYLEELLKMRCQAKRSTIITSSRTPRQWARDSVFGHGTAKIMAELGMGLIVDPANPEDIPLLNRIKIPGDDHYEFFHTTGLALLDWVDDSVRREPSFNFGQATWHWVELPDFQVSCK